MERLFTLTFDPASDLPARMATAVGTGWALLCWCSALAAVAGLVLARTRARRRRALCAVLAEMGIKEE